MLAIPLRRSEDLSPIEKATYLVVADVFRIAVDGTDTTTILLAVGNVCLLLDRWRRLHRGLASCLFFLFGGVALGTFFSGVVPIRSDVIAGGSSSSLSIIDESEGTCTREINNIAT